MVEWLSLIGIARRPYAEVLDPATVGADDLVEHTVATTNTLLVAPPWAPLGPLPKGTDRVLTKLLRDLGLPYLGDRVAQVHLVGDAHEAHLRDHVAPDVLVQPVHVRGVSRPLTCCLIDDNRLELRREAILGEQLHLRHSLVARRAILLPKPLWVELADALFLDEFGLPHIANQNWVCPKVGDDQTNQIKNRAPQTICCSF